ncbi:MAG: glycosyl hydrolase family 39, partial [Parafilimonas sp.]
RLSPKTITTINEIGTIIGANGDDIPDNYWNLSGAMYAYIFLELTKIGIDVAGESQLVGYPSQFPDVSMMDWKNGKPNARYWILKMIKDNFKPGDKLVETSVSGGNIMVQAFITSKGKRILFINPRNKEVKIKLPADAKDATINYVDAGTGESPYTSEKLNDTEIILKPFSVSVVELN